VFFWEWSHPHKIVRTIKAHEGVAIGCVWHPMESSKVITCGWDGLVRALGSLFAPCSRALLRRLRRAAPWFSMGRAGRWLGGGDRGRDRERAVAAARQGASRDGQPGRACAAWPHPPINPQHPHHLRSKCGTDGRRRRRSARCPPRRHCPHCPALWRSTPLVVQSLPGLGVFRAARGGPAPRCQPIQPPHLLSCLGPLTPAPAPLPRPCACAPRCYMPPPRPAQPAPALGR
jgi:hypothetical protein